MGSEVPFFILCRIDFGGFTDNELDAFLFKVGPYLESRIGGITSADAHPGIGGYKLEGVAGVDNGN